METPDSRITNLRQGVFVRTGKVAFDAICFSFYICPTCKQETISNMLMPVAGKENLSSDLIRQANEMILDQIFNAEFDFLLEKRQCRYCSSKSTLSLKRIIYCYADNNIDHHNYIDYPFEEIKSFQFPLEDKQNNTTNKFLFFDTETTGLPKNWKASYKDLNNWPRLVQLAWIIGDDNGSIIKLNNYIIKPQGFSIPYEATKVHKISTLRAEQEGKDIQIVLKEFAKDIAQADYLVAHNMNFDINVVGSELYRNSIESDIFKKKKICTMESTVDFCKINGGYYGYKYPKLSELYQKLFNSIFEEAHDASADVNAV